jgi:predicted ABC-type transport system involved in lysophospholipase L1 biosynthesis ATPase subunit
MSDRAIIRMEGLEKTYQLGDVLVQALRGVHLAIEAGSYVAIMGSDPAITMLNLLGYWTIHCRFLLSGWRERGRDER